MSLDEAKYEEILKIIYPSEPDREQREKIEVLRRATLDYALLLTDVVESSPKRDQALSSLFLTLQYATHAVLGKNNLSSLGN